MELVVIGSINMDVVSRVGKHPQAGETVKSQDFLYVPGGKGANQAVAAKRLGAEVSLVGKVGDDAFGQELLQFFRDEQMSPTWIKVSGQTPTGAAFVAVDSEAENVIYVSGGANEELNKSDIDDLALTKKSIVSATLETPVATTEAVFNKAKSVGAITVLNAAPAIIEGEKLFNQCDYLILNEVELAAYAKSEVPTTKREAADLMTNKIKGPKHIITTLGKKGVVGIFEGQAVEVEGHQITAVDSTGAGDCFCGAFLTALTEGQEPSAAMRFANLAASISVQKIGAAVAMPTREEVGA